MTNRSQISEHLAKYLNGRLDLDNFEDWIVANTWDIHLGNDPMAAHLAYAIEESFAEYSSGHLSESELKEEFRGLLVRPEPQSVFEFALSSDGEKFLPPVRPSVSGSIIAFSEPKARAVGHQVWDHQALV